MAEENQTKFENITCDYCGRRKITSRLTVKGLISQFIDTTFSLDKGFLYTLKYMFLSPQKPIISFIEGYRKPFTLPAKFLVVTITISVLATFFYDIETFSVVKITDEKAQNASIFYEYYQRFLNIILFSLIPPISFFTWLLGNKKKFNYAENLIANAYLYGTYSFVSAIFITLSSFVMSYSLVVSSSISNLSIIYLLYGYYRFYDGRWYGKLLRAFATMLFTFLCLGAGVATLILILNLTGLASFD